MKKNMCRRRADGGCSESAIRFGGIVAQQGLDFNGGVREASTPPCGDLMTLDDLDRQADAQQQPGQFIVGVCP